MIVFTPLWETMRKKNITTYTLIAKHGFSSSTISRFRNNKAVTTTTINDLCRILECGIEDIMEYKEEE